MPGERARQATQARVGGSRFSSQVPCAVKARKSALGSTALKEEHQEARQRGRLTEKSTHIGRVANVDVLLNGGRSFFPFSASSFSF